MIIASKTLVLWLVHRLLSAQQSTGIVAIYELFLILLRKRSPCAFVCAATEMHIVAKGFINILSDYILYTTKGAL
jgi:hypothetical protein